ncbi:hypothetical protein EDS67_04630 [candidate division KSB1 bacterium]|nr:MAG: hypothetical protein EDS67_04630 [candidate division KSB1 bacterium]MCE7940558.1 hypothetical protein [Chlorobi bacterium CHB1]MDL1877011.1 hypothetical protein [Cytophagia bacterium CHB2]
MGINWMLVAGRWLLVAGFEKFVLRRFCSPRPLWADVKNHEVAVTAMPHKGQDYEIVVKQYTSNKQPMIYLSQTFNFALKKTTYRGSL